MIFWSVIALILAIGLGIWWWSHEPENREDEDAMEKSQKSDKSER